MQEDQKIPEGNVHPDNSVLSKDSEFYQPEDNRTTREKLRTMNFKDKVIFIGQYYGLKILAVIAIAAVVLYFILHYAFLKDSVLNIVAVNAQDIATTSAAADTQDFYDAFLKQNHFDPDDVQIGIDSSFNALADDSNSSNMQNIQAIQVNLMAGTDDVVFSDEEFMTSIGETGYLTDITKCLPQDVLDKYTDDLLYVTDVDAKVKMAVGVRLHDNDWIAKSGWFANVKEPVIGICSSAQNQDTAKAFLLYVLGEE